MTDATKTTAVIRCLKNFRLFFIVFFFFFFNIGFDALTSYYNCITRLSIKCSQPFVYARHLHVAILYTYRDMRSVFSSNKTCISPSLACTVVPYKYIRFMCIIIHVINWASDRNPIVKRVYCICTQRNNLIKKKKKTQQKRVNGSCLQNMVYRVSNNHCTCLTCMIHRISRQCNKVIFWTMSMRVLIYRPRYCETGTDRFSTYFAWRSPRQKNNAYCTYVRASIRWRS
jgi:hypothetical protein